MSHEPRLALVGENAIVARDGDVYIAGQPSPADLDDWQARGVRHLVNLRSRAETQELPFDLAAEAAARGMTYTEIPMGGLDGVHPEIRERLTAALADAEGPVALHCAGGPRAAYAYAAHLIATGALRPEDLETLGWPGPMPPDVIAALLPR